LRNAVDLFDLDNIVVDVPSVLIVDRVRAEAP
jgi:hypothetical protein